MAKKNKNKSKSKNKAKVKKKQVRAQVVHEPVNPKSADAPAKNIETASLESENNAVASKIGESETIASSVANGVQLNQKMPLSHAHMADNSSTTLDGDARQQSGHTRVGKANEIGHDQPNRNLPKTNKTAIKNPANLDDNQAKAADRQSQRGGKIEAMSNLNKGAPIFSAAWQILAVATLAIVAMTLLAGYLGESGVCIITAIGGQFAGKCENELPTAVRYFYFLDMVFPLTYATGFSVYALGHLRNGVRPLVRLVMVLAVLAGLADILENTSILPVLLGHGETAPVPYTFMTVIKYSSLMIGGIFLSIVITGEGNLIRLAKLNLRLVLPILISLNLAELISPDMRPILSLISVLTIVLLLIDAFRKSRH